MDRTRVLVVDDDQSITRTVKAVLERTGRFEVKEENSSDKALAAAREFRPDLIVLDLVMPVVDGATIAAELREHDEFGNVPLAFLTALVPKTKGTERAKTIGGYPFLSKPFDVDRLVEFVDECLSRVGKSGIGGESNALTRMPLED